MILKTIPGGKTPPSIQQLQSGTQTFNFFQDKGLCQYHNHCSISKAIGNFSNNSEIKVMNKIGKECGEFIEKVTIVKFNDEIIAIKDRYKFVSHLPNNADDSQQKRVHIFKKSLHNESKNQGKRRVTKNLPKNFIKAFKNYLEEIKDEKNSQLLECKMKLLSSRQKFNNSFIQRIVDDQDLEPYFSQFLQSYAKDWIENSKIRDKNVHFQAIQIFKKLCESRSDKKQVSSPQVMQLLQSLDNSSHHLSDFSKQSINSDRQSIYANQSRDLQSFDEL